MSKTLVYTVSNFNDATNSCTSLLLESIKINNSNFDFCVLSDREPPKNYLYNVIVDNSYKNYIPSGKEWPGLTRYSDLLPKNYDHYVYFDSDVLCFDRLEAIFPIKDKVLSVATEHGACPNNEGIVEHTIHRMCEMWYCYPAATDLEKNEMQNYIGYNVGVLSFNNVSVLKQIRVLIDNVLTKMTHYPGDPHSKIYTLDQTPLNYFCFKNKEKIHDICHKINNYTRGSRLQRNQKISEDVSIFHFTGIQQGMGPKLYHMTDFWKHKHNLVSSRYLKI